MFVAYPELQTRDSNAFILWRYCGWGRVGMDIIDSGELWEPRRWERTCLTAGRDCPEGPASVFAIALLFWRRDRDEAIVAATILSFH
jgi:hypothetical protein